MIVHVQNSRLNYVSRRSPSERLHDVSGEAYVSFDHVRQGFEKRRRKRSPTRAFFCLAASTSPIRLRRSVACRFSRDVCVRRR